MDDARSAGGVKAHGPASCIAPYPDRLTCLWPSGNVDIKRPSSQGRRGGPYESFAVAPVAELVGKRWMGRMPAELGPGPGRVGALVEQQDLGEVVAQAGSGLVIGPGDRSWRAGGDRGRLGQFGHGRVHSVADDVAAAGRVIFQDAPEDIRQVGDVHGRPALLPGAEHDQVAGVVPGRTEKQPGNPSPAVTVGDAGDDHDGAHAGRAEHPAFDRLLPYTIAGAWKGDSS